MRWTPDKTCKVHMDAGLPRCAQAGTPPPNPLSTNQNEEGSRIHVCRENTRHPNIAQFSDLYEDACFLEAQVLVKVHRSFVREGDGGVGSVEVFLSKRLVVPIVMSSAQAPATECGGDEDFGLDRCRASKLVIKPRAGRIANDKPIEIRHKQAIRASFAN